MVIWVLCKCISGFYCFSIRVFARIKDKITSLQRKQQSHCYQCFLPPLRWRQCL